MAELFEEFDEQLAPFLSEAFVESIEKWNLTPTLTQGLISLIPKPRKDHLLIGQYVFSTTTTTFFH